MFSTGDVVEVRSGMAKGQLARVVSVSGNRVLVEFLEGGTYSGTNNYTPKSLKLVTSARQG